MTPSVSSIIRATALRFEVKPERITQPDGIGARDIGIVRPRQVAMYLAREISTTPGWRRKKERSPVSYPTLARIFGRDHTTVIHAVQTVPKLAENDSDLAEKINEIRSQFEAKALAENDFAPASGFIFEPDA